MACPYFRPNKSGAVCGVGGDVNMLPALCREGYARAICRSFPSDSGADAVLITAALETAATVAVRYSVERGYLPVSVGEHHYSYESRKWKPTIADTNIRAQMNAYIDRFLQLRRENIACQTNL